MKFMDLWGQALKDYHTGDLAPEGVITVDASGEEELEDLGIYFQEEQEAHLDVAYSQCRGSILDVGAGVGRHALALQSRGLSVVALEPSQTACEIMMSRGVLQVQCADIFHFTSERRFETILILDSLGLAGTLAGLERLFRYLSELLLPGGQIILDADVGAESETGEDHWQMRYRGNLSEPLPWLAFVDQIRCREIAHRCGFEFRLEGEFDELYVASLKKAS